MIKLEHFYYLKFKASHCGQAHLVSTLVANLKKNLRHKGRYRHH